MDVMGMVTKFATPVLASKIAGALGMPEGIVKKVLSLGVPLVLGAMLKGSSSSKGAAAFTTAFDKTPDNALDMFSEALGGSAAANSATTAATMGSSMLSSLVGGSTESTLVSKLASYAGVDAKSAGPLLGLASSMAMAGVKKTAADQGLDAAGALKMLGEQKADISGALPADFLKSLEGTGLLGDIEHAAGKVASKAEAAASTAAKATERAVEKVAEPVKKSGLSRWIVLLAIAALLLWLLPKFLGNKDVDEAVDGAKDAVSEAADTATDAASSAVSALVVDGVDLGESFTGTIGELTAAMKGITDKATAEAALPSLTKIGETLTGYEAGVKALSEEGKSALQKLVAAELPALETASGDLSSNGTFGSVVKPALDGIVGQLKAFAG
jgi:hypothetical protein